MSEISTTSHADHQMLWSHAIEMEDFDLAQQIKDGYRNLVTRLEDIELSKWSIIDLTAQQQVVCDEWFLGPEGYAAFEATNVPSKLGGTALRGERRNLWMSSAQLAADRGDWYDF